MFKPKTYWLPRPAISIPAINGPMILDAFIANPFNVRAGARCSRFTRSGTMTANTGQRIASPIPFMKVKNRRSSAFRRLKTIKSVRMVALAASQSWVRTKYFLRFKISAKAPLGTPSKRTGKLDAVCTNAISKGESVKDVIIHAAATSFIHIQMLAMSQTIQRVRKTLNFKGDSQ